VTNFAEEVVRSQGVLCLAKLVDALSEPVRKAAGVGPWRWVSRAEMTARGKAVAGSLAAICGAMRSGPHVLVVDEVDGTEDLPEWVAAAVGVQDAAY
jgi:hypothetical protein